MRRRRWCRKRRRRYARESLPRSRGFSAGDARISRFVRRMKRRSRQVSAAERDNAETQRSAEKPRKVGNEKNVHRPKSVPRAAIARAGITGQAEKRRQAATLQQKQGQDRRAGLKPGTTKGTQRAANEERRQDADGTR